MKLKSISGTCTSGGTLVMAGIGRDEKVYVSVGSYASWKKLDKAAGALDVAFASVSVMSYGDTVTLLATDIEGRAWKKVGLTDATMWTQINVDVK